MRSAIRLSKNGSGTKYPIPIKKKKEEFLSGWILGTQPALTLKNYLLKCIKPDRTRTRTLRVPKCEIFDLNNPDN